VYWHKICKPNTDCFLLNKSFNIPAATPGFQRLKESASTGVWIRNIQLQRLSHLSLVLVMAPGYCQRAAMGRFRFRKTEVARIVKNCPMFRTTQRYTDTFTRHYRWHWHGWPQCDSRKLSVENNILIVCRHTRLPVKGVFRKFRKRVTKTNLL